MYSSLLYIIGQKDIAGAFVILSKLLGCCKLVDINTLGSKILLFILYCFENRIFPRGDAYRFPTNQIIALTEAIISRTIIEESACVGFVRAIMSHVGAAGHKDCSRIIAEKSTEEYPYMTQLLSVDPMSLFFCLGRAATGLALHCDTSDRNRPGNMYGEIYKFASTTDAKQDATNNRCQRLFLEYSIDNLLVLKFPLPKEVTLAAIRFASMRSPRSKCEQRIIPFVLKQAGAVDKRELSSHLLTCNLWRIAIKFNADSGAESLYSSSNFTKGLDSYLSDRETKTRLLVFDFINEHFQLSPTSIDKDAANTDRRKSTIIRVLPLLAELDSTKMKQIASSYLSDCIAQVFDHTRKHPLIQLDCLEAFAEHARRVGETLDSIFTGAQLTVYVRQLVSCKPDRVHSVLVSSTQYDGGECLKACEEKAIFDASCYLLKKQRGIDDALDYGLSLLIGIVRRIERQITHTQPVVGSSSSVSSSSSLGGGGVMEQSASQREVISKLRYLGQLCRSDQVQCVNMDPWVKILDNLLHECRQAERKSSPILGLINTLVREFIGLMRSHVPAKEVFKCITRDSMAGSHLGQFRDIMVNLTQSFSQDIKMHALSLKVASYDVQEVSKTRAKSSRQGRRYDSLGDAIKDKADITEIDLWTTPPAVPTQDTDSVVEGQNYQGLYESMKLISKPRHGTLMLKETRGSQGVMKLSLGGNLSERFPGCLPLEATFNGEMPEGSVSY